MTPVAGIWEILEIIKIIKIIIGLCGTAIHELQPSDSLC